MSGETNVTQNSASQVPGKDIPLVIAIDFGTSYSGYGYQFSDEYCKDPMLVSHPQPFNGGHRNLLSHKTSTCILLNRNFEFDSFGFESEEKFQQISDSNEYEQFYFFRNFKMKLHGQKELDTDFYLLDESGRKKLPAITVFSLAIKCLKDHALQTIRNERVGDIDESNIMWALTVPAIWNESATQFMNDAAVRAGIERENLKIVFEPEAASFACRNLPVSIPNQPACRGYFSEVPLGTIYMVIDLGGGTADIVIHKKIDQNKVKEISRPSGGPWGGTAVDSNFVDFLITIVGKEVLMELKQSYPSEYADLMKEFEVAKRYIDQTKKDKIKFKVPLQLSYLCRMRIGKSFKEAVEKSKYKDKIMFKLNDQNAFLDPEIFYSFFEPVAEEIVKYVEHTLETRQGSHVSLLLLIGGFSESKYIQNIMKNKFQSGNRDVLIPKDPGLSVIKGAVVFVREEKLLAFRIRDVTFVTALHIGQNMTSMAIQFKTNFEQDPNTVLGVMFPGRHGGQITYTSDSVLIDRTMKVDSIGNDAVEKYKKLCDSSKEKEDNIELILKDQNNVQIKAIYIMTIYITHALNNLKTQFRDQHVYDLIEDTHFVLTAPANWNERASIRLLSDAAGRAGLREENITVVLESEAINQYCKINILWKDFNIADAPIESIVVIANLAEIKGEMIFHKKRSMGIVSGAYKTVSGHWGTRSLSDGFMETLRMILGMELVETFKRKYPNIYSDLCKTIIARAKQIKLDQINSVNLRFPVQTFDEFCKKNFSKSFKECVEGSKYFPKIQVESNVKIDVDASLFKGIIRRITDSIVGHVQENREKQRKCFFVLTGGFSDYEMLETIISPKLDNIGVKTVIIHSDHCPVLKGAIAYGFICG